jgi:hypothetical protein
MLVKYDCSEIRFLIGLSIFMILVVCLPVLAQGAWLPSNYLVVLGPASKHPRVLPFPKDYSLGEIEIIDWPPRTPKKELCGAAKDTVIVPPGKMSRLVPAYHYYKDPSLVNTLPPDGFDSILLAASSLADSEDGLCDRALSGVGRLKGLVELDLDRSDATDAGVAHAADLPNLQKITAFSANIEGRCLKQFSGLKQLRYLRLPRNPLKDENLQYLAAVPQLQYLSLTKCNIGDAGIKNMAGCAKLVSLNIAGNPRITDQSIKYLLNLKKLRYLVIGDTSITVKGALQLQALHLAGIDLPPRNCSKAELNELHKAFPNILIAAPRSHTTTVDPETNTLFAPLH